MNASVRPVGHARLLARHEYEQFFGLLILCLLLLSTLDETGVAPVTRGLSLVCFAVLTVVNTGAAVGVYMGAALLFGVHHFSGQGSWVERPDNYALLLLVFYLVLGRAIGRKVGVFGRTAIVIGLLLATSVLHLASLGKLDAFHFTWFLRMFGIPLGLFVLLRRAALRTGELTALWFCLGAIAVYLGAETILESLRWYTLVIPPWIGDPSFNPVYGYDRIGGLLMQPEWNALEISLALCILGFQTDIGANLKSIGRLVGAGVCVVAVYLTYTRAAWLGLLLAGLPTFWYSSGKRGMTIKRRALFVAFVVVVAAVTLLFPSQVTESRMADSGTVFYRFNLWVMGFRMVMDHPLLGVGFGEFIEHVGNYEQAGGWIPGLVTGGVQFGDLAHNTFLSVSAELGLIGLLLYVSAIIGVYRAGRSAASALWGQRGKAWIDAFSIIYFVNVQFVTAHELNTNVMYFAVMGAIAGRSAWTSVQLPRRVLPSA